MTTYYNILLGKGLSIPVFDALVRPAIGKLAVKVTKNIAYLGLSEDVSPSNTALDLLVQLSYEVDDLYGILKATLPDAERSIQAYRKGGLSDQGITISRKELEDRPYLSEEVPNTEPGERTGEVPLKPDFYILDRSDDVAISNQSFADTRAKYLSLSGAEALSSAAEEAGIVIERLKEAVAFGIGNYAVFTYEIGAGQGSISEMLTGLEDLGEHRVFDFTIQDSYCFEDGERPSMVVSIGYKATSRGAGFGETRRYMEKCLKKLEGKEPTEELQGRYIFQGIQSSVFTNREAFNLAIQETRKQ